MRGLLYSKTVMVWATERPQVYWKPGGCFINSQSHCIWPEELVISDGNWIKKGLRAHTHPHIASTGAAPILRCYKYVHLYNLES